MFKEDLFEGKVAIVTGGGTGIGKEIVREMIALNCNVMICGRREEKLKAAVEELGDRVSYVVCDLRKEEEVKELYDKTIEKYGKLDYVINNAGGQFIAKFENISTNAFDSVVKTNLYGTWFSCKEAVKHLKEGGKIINVVHIYAIRAGPGISHSGAARAGVINLSKSLALELGERGIAVNAIAPGITQTQGFKEEMINNQEMIKQLKETIPMHRFADPKEVAELCVYLCNADYITGETIAIDGGQVLGNWPDFTKLQEMGGN